MKIDHLKDHELHNVNTRGLPDEALDAFEQVINAAIAEVTNPETVPPGELREVPKLDPYGRVSETRFYGESFVQEMNRPGLRVVSFRTDQGFVDASGKALR